MKVRGDGRPEEEESEEQRPEEEEQWPEKSSMVARGRQTRDSVPLWPNQQKFATSGPSDSPFEDLGIIAGLRSDKDLQLVASVRAARGTIFISNDEMEDLGFEGTGGKLEQGFDEKEIVPYFCGPNKRMGMMGHNPFLGIQGPTQLDLDKSNQNDPLEVIGGWVASVLNPTLKVRRNEVVLLNEGEEEDGRNRDEEEDEGSAYTQETGKGKSITYFTEKEFERDTRKMIINQCLALDLKQKVQLKREYRKVLMKQAPVAKRRGQIGEDEVIHAPEWLMEVIDVVEVDEDTNEEIVTQKYMEAQKFITRGPDGIMRKVKLRKEDFIQLSTMMKNGMVTQKTEAEEAGQSMPPTVP